MGNLQHADFMHQLHGGAFPELQSHFLSIHYRLNLI